MSPIESCVRAVDYCANSESYNAIHGQLKFGALTPTLGFQGGFENES